MDRGVGKVIVCALGKICQYPLFKSIYSALYIAAMFCFSAELINAMIALLLLIFIDFATAIGACYVKGIEIKSRKILTTAIKITIYFMLIACGHFVEKAIPIIVGFVEQAILGFLVLTEMISILENTGKMGFAIPKKLLNKLEDLRDSK